MTSAVFSDSSVSLDRWGRTAADSSSWVDAGNLYSARSVTYPTAVSAGPGWALQRELSAALDDAKRWQFGLPSVRALMVARALLQIIGLTLWDPECVEIAVAEDGSIEFVSQVGPNLVTVSIPQSGSGIEMVVRDTETGQLVVPATYVTPDEVARRLERAA